MKKQNIQQSQKSQQSTGSPTENQEFSSNSIMQPFYTTDPAEVQKEIASDVARGEGAMTSREAGHLRSEDR